MTSQAAVLSQADAASSLLSLSAAAASALPIPTTVDTTHPTGNVGNHGLLSASLNSNPTSPVSTSLGATTRHRRLASTGKTRRRLSDARDAANRPSPALLQSSTAALSLASLTLSSSPPAGGSLPNVSASFTGASNTLNGLLPGSHQPQVGGSNSQPASSPSSDGSNFLPSAVCKLEGHHGSETTTTPIAIGQGKSGRKRGIDHKCESCSKIYRHPSCLIKHRWEHTPHWREASKFVLSKHQQVQLLEAAAILSHLSPSATSLPDDRSLWPSFLSGGSLPGAESASPPINGSSAATAGLVVSSSVPATASGNFSRAASSGPRLHDYSVPTSTTGSGGITQLRPGLLGVPTGSTGGVVGSGGGEDSTTSTPSKPVPVPNNSTHNSSDPLFREYRHGGGGGAPDSWTSSFISNGLSSGSIPFAHSDERSLGTGTGGSWSLPRSSLRSVSASSQSQSRSRSRSGSASADDDESVADIDVDGDGDGGDGDGDGGSDVERPTSRYAGRYGYKGAGGGRKGPGGGLLPMWKKEDEDEMSIGFSVREEDEGGDGDDDDECVINGAGAVKRKETEWDGLEMDMDMD